MTHPATRASAIYVGEVSHIRLRPRRHALRYRIFMLLLDLDELAALHKRLRWFSLGRFNLTSFRERDHGDGSETPLRTQIERHLDAAGLPIAGGPIRLLCLPRMLGYVFNPLSVYFCYTRDQRLQAILYEVSSTFGERHSYLMPAEPDARGVVRQSAAKRLHVSPFMDMDLDYRFRIRPPAETLDITIGTIDHEGLLLNARFAAERRPLNDSGLLRAWIAHPLLTVKVIVGIHWEAIRLIAKGLRLKSGAKAPAEPVSLGTAQARRYSIEEPSLALPRSAIQASAGSYQSAISVSPRSL
jgi:DUF1365 family protein